MIKKSLFGSFNPWITTIYYMIAAGLIMASQSPVYLGMAFVAGMIHRTFLVGKKDLKRLMVTFFLIGVFSVLLNGLFTHNGETVLFYLGSNRITMEAILYGAVMSLLIMDMIIWFSSMGKIMTSDKLIYVFGGIAPVLGLLISMIFRFIPLLRNRFAEIKAGQQALGRGEIKRPMDRLSVFVKEVSTLISWSLEASIESADSMAARGYGLKGRSSFTLFTFNLRDGALLAIIIALGAAVAYGYALGVGKLFYYPAVRWAVSEGSQGISLITYLSFSTFLIIPSALDFYGEYKWQRL